MGITHGYKDMPLYWRLLRQARPYWSHVGGFFLLDMLAGPLALLNPIPLKIVVDSVIGSHPLPDYLSAILPSGVAESKFALLMFAASMVVVFSLLGQIQSVGVSLTRMYVGERLILDFRSLLFRHAQRLSLSYHDSNGAIESTNRIQNDAPAIQYVTIDGVIPFITSSVTVVMMFYIMLRLDWQLSLVAMAVAPVFLFSSRFYRRRLRSQSRVVKKLESDNISVVQEVLAALRIVKAFGQEERELERFVSQSKTRLRERIKLLIVEGSYGMLLGLTAAFGTATVLFVGVRHVQSGALTLGQLLLVMGYLAQLYEPIKTIGRKAASLQGHLASAERAFSLLDVEPDVPERPDALQISRAAGAVSFQNVSFAYEENRPTLRDISFHVEPGTRVGIAGTTGAGKTTLVSLLSRFYDPTGGRILLDGVDLKDYKLSDLRRQFAIVLQDPVLFSASIFENIAYARPDASEEEVVRAAQAANAHDFISRLPDGYQTLVGDRGMRLSGGERQRISLARAFLKDSPILILDEPTSSVDVKTEALIMEAMERLMRDRTTFMIAHRLSTLQNCDLLLLIEKGQLIAVTSDATTISRGINLQHA